MIKDIYSRVTLYEKLVELNNSDMYPLHMPGHKRNPDSGAMSQIYGIDITEIDGFDDLHAPDGILLDMSVQAARLYGADRAYISVNGSTAANEAAIMGLACQGDEILIARNSHKSVYYAVEMAGANPIYFFPGKIPGTDIYDVASADCIEKKLVEHPNCKLVVITSPTYEGLIADIDSISKKVHSHGAVLIVDAAHGAHLNFMWDGKYNPLKQGADIVITSLHKMLPAPTQTALLLLNSSVRNFKSIEHYMHMLQTSSPSYILMAGVGEALKYIETDAKEDMDSLLNEINTLHSRLCGCEHIQISQDLFGAKVCDPCKLIIYSPTGEMTGREIYDMLRDKYHIQCEMCGADYALGILSVMDTHDGFERIAEALIKMDAELADSPVEHTEAGDLSEAVLEAFNPRCVMSAKAALQLPTCEKLIDEAQGKTAAEYIIVYPPGMPLIVPGEIISKEVIGIIHKYKELQLNLIGNDSKLEHITVVCDK